MSQKCSSINREQSLIPVYKIIKNCKMSYSFDIDKLLNDPTRKYGIVVLNCPLKLPVPFFKKFWNNASFRITADGGTNRWFSYLSENKVQSDEIKPMDLVTGDFDSITSESKEMAIKLGAKVVPTPDQDETDFTKAVNKMKEYAEKSNINLESIFVLQVPSGRMDQTISNINTLYQYEKETINLFLLSYDSMFWLLKKGDNTLTIPPSIVKFNNAWCGLIPIREKCEWVKTTGLKWNLDGDSMEFGKLISTSNTFDGVSGTVTVSTKNTLFWCMDLRPFFIDLFGISEEGV